jgi:hypothetical protein
MQFCVPFEPRRMFRARSRTHPTLRQSVCEEAPVQIDAKSRDSPYWVYYTRWRQKLQPKSRIFSPFPHIFW